jgi:hypothetical protein
MLIANNMDEEVGKTEINIRRFKRERERERKKIGQGKVVFGRRGLGMLLLAVEEGYNKLNVFGIVEELGA